ncbi:MAG: hypothetical protein ACKO9Z_16380 [Planctomycetota bacterium]
MKITRIMVECGFINAAREHEAEHLLEAIESIQSISIERSPEFGKMREQVGKVMDLFSILCQTLGLTRFMESFSAIKRHPDIAEQAQTILRKIAEIDGSLARITGLIHETQKELEKALYIHAETLESIAFIKAKLSEDA